MAKRTLELLDRIGNTLLSLKVVGEKQSVFSTRPLTLVLLREAPDALVNGKTLNGGNGEVRLPSSKDLLGIHANAMGAVNFQVGLKSFVPASNAAQRLGMQLAHSLSFRSAISPHPK